MRLNTIVKVGGSLCRSDGLAGLCTELGSLGKRHPILVVPGGGDEGVGHVQPVLVEVGHQGQQGAHMQEDVKAQAAAGYVKIVLKEGQVAGAGNGEKLGNALNHAEEDGDKGVHNGGMYHGSREQAI